MNNLLRFVRGHEPDVTALSARLDGQLNAPASARLDEHVAACDKCRNVLDGLRATRDALRALPEMEAPRSFRLRAADVARAPVTAAGGTGVLRWAPALGAAAAAVFVVALAADLRSNDRGVTRSSAPSAARPATGAESNDSAGLSAGKSAPGTGATAAAALAPVPSPANAADADRAPAAATAPPAPGPAGAMRATASPGAQASGAYAETATADGRSAAAPPATAESGSLAATAAGGDAGGGNNATALRVIEIIAGAIVLAAAPAVIVGRRRGERT